MSLSERDRNAVRKTLDDPQALADLLGQLKLGTRKPVGTKHENFAELKWWLKSAALVAADAEGVRAAAELIGGLGRPPVVIEVAPPPGVDVEKEKRKILADAAYTETIRGVVVQLDKDQNKHQPKEVPIGTRQIHGEKFGTYATKAWHKQHTMAYMADWAARQTGLEEGKKVDHGQAQRVPITGLDRMVCFEGFCMLLGGTRYVSFHCYPNSR